MAALPKKIEKYYEPFVGGGAVFFGNTWQNECLLNDKSEELMMLYNCVKTKNRIFLKALQSINSIWKMLETFVHDNLQEIHLLYDYCGSDKREKTADFIKKSKNLEIIYAFASCMSREEIQKVLLDCVYDKLIRTKKIENERGTLENQNDFFDNFESAFKRGVYTVFRDIYNKKKKLKLSNGLSAALFFYMREYCYSSMYRYNAAGEFNVPYGGVSYNHKYMDDKIEYIKSSEMSEKFSKTTLHCHDFYDFMKEFPPENSDFIFLDPPYDTEFSSYANCDFSQNDQKRLADYLIKECKGNWMLVIKRTDFISSLYPVGTRTANGKQIFVSDFDKKYLVSFKNRNNKDCKHLVITNYEVTYG
jgi:DNA adenine methylase